VIVINGIADSLFTTLNRARLSDLDHENDGKGDYVVASSITSIICLGMFLFGIYLLWSSVKLLRKFIDDHSNQKQNEKTAWLHIIMISTLCITTVVASLIRIAVNIKDFANHT